MPRGHPDWNILTTPEVLAPGTFDRRGEILFKDDFEDGLNPWIQSVSGLGAGIVLVTADTDLGVNAAELTSGSDVSRNAILRKNFALPSAQRMGFEASIWTTTTAFETLNFTIDRFDGVNRQQGVVRITFIGGVLAFLNSGGTFTDFATPNVGSSSEARYHRYKLVVDFVTGEYVRFLYDEEEFDISGNAVRATALAIPQGYSVALSLASPSAQNDVVQVGRMVITENEP